MEAVELVVDGAQMHALINGRDGPVLRYLIRRADIVIVEARRILEPHKITGDLAQNIVKRITDSPLGPGVRIVATQPYAHWVHEGNAPPGSYIYPTHTRPNGGRAMLRFVSTIDTDRGPAGGVVYVWRVKASVPIPFLRDAMKRVA